MGNEDHTGAKVSQKGSVLFAQSSKVLLVSLFRTLFVSLFVERVSSIAVRVFWAGCRWLPSGPNAPHGGGSLGGWCFRGIGSAEMRYFVHMLAEN
jgi:hypothetical protein